MEEAHAHNVVGQIEVIVCILKVAVEFYLLLSLIYILLYLPENLAFQWRHANNNFIHKASGILLTLGLSLVFGGISLAQKVKNLLSKKIPTISRLVSLGENRK